MSSKMTNDMDTNLGVCINNVQQMAQRFPQFLLRLCCISFGRWVLQKKSLNSTLSLNQFDKNFWNLTRQYSQHTYTLTQFNHLLSSNCSIYFWAECSVCRCSVIKWACSNHVTIVYGRLREKKFDRTFLERDWEKIEKICQRTLLLPHPEGQLELIFYEDQ